MNTTSLVIELLIGGYMALAWVAVLGMAIVGLPSALAVSTFVKDAGLVSALLVTSFAYFLGILVDRVADTLLDRPDLAAQRRHTLAGDPPMLEMQAFSFARSPESATRIGYQQSRLRVVRAGVLNVALLLASLGLLVALQPDARLHAGRIVALLAVVGCVFVATVYSYLRITDSYWRRTRSEFAALSQLPSSKD